MYINKMVILFSKRSLKLGNTSLKKCTYRYVFTCKDKFNLIIRMKRNKFKVFHGQKYMYSGFFFNTASCCRSFSFLTIFLNFLTVYGLHAEHWREES